MQGVKRTTVPIKDGKEGTALLILHIQKSRVRILHGYSTKKTSKVACQ
jgi:hypothetical protein